MSDRRAGWCPEVGGIANGVTIDLSTYIPRFVFFFLFFYCRVLVLSLHPLVFTARASTFYGVVCTPGYTNYSLKAISTLFYQIYS
jgi:hypothetical protein